MTQNGNNEHQYTFPQKVWITGGIFAFIIILLMLLKATFSVFLLVLAGTLIAIFFRGLSDLIKRKTGWNSTLSLTLSVLITIVLIAAVFWLIGAKLQVQIAQLSDTLPATVENAKAKLNESPIGQKLVEKISSPKAMRKAEVMASTFFRSTFGVLGDVYVVLFIGLFFTVSPKLYTSGMVKLAPESARDKTESVLHTLGENLKKWLKGKLFAMMVVFILTAIGLLIIGMPMWLALALIAGILNFIPNFGPIIAMIPAVLVALLQGPATAGIVAGLYVLIQVAESNFITPMVQQKLINIPPALIIITQLLMGALTGGWGIILATPVMIILMILVQELYIKKMEQRPNGDG